MSDKDNEAIVKASEAEALKAAKRRERVANIYGAFEAAIAGDAALEEQVEKILNDRYETCSLKDIDSLERNFKTVEIASAQAEMIVAYAKGRMPSAPEPPKTRTFFTSATSDKLEGRVTPNDMVETGSFLHELLDVIAEAGFDCKGVADLIVKCGVDAYKVFLIPDTKDMAFPFYFEFDNELPRDVFVVTSDKPPAYAYLSVDKAPAELTPIIESMPDSITDPVDVPSKKRGRPAKG